MAQPKSKRPSRSHWQHLAFREARLEPPEGINLHNVKSAIRETLAYERGVGEYVRAYPDTPAGRRQEAALLWVDVCRENGLNPFTGREVELDGDFFAQLDGNGEDEETGERVWAEDDEEEEDW